ncbi:MAG: hypothetical protein WC365_05790 [Candidatus Babeliales bacterium]
MVYLISYDLIAPGQKYNAVSDAIKKASYLNNWLHPLESTWIIKSYNTAAAIYENIKTAFDANDRFAIFEVTKNYYGALDAETWKTVAKMFD